MAWSKVRWRLPALISGLLTLLGLLLALYGGPLMLVWLGALASFSILLLRWMKPGPAIASTTIAFLSAELLLLRISPLLPIGLIGCELVVWTCVGLGCAAGSVVGRPLRMSWTRREVAVAAAALSGVALTVVWLIIDLLDPVAVHVAWAMFDDAVRDLVESRLIVAERGIVSTSVNQTPLPFGIVASNMTPGRGGLHGGELLRHDVTRMAQVWMAAAAATCLLLGSVVAHSVRRLRPIIAVPLVAGTSLFGLSWWVLGIPLYGGFINATFGIIVLVACWLGYLNGGRRPLLLALLLIAGCTVMLSVWPPLVLCIVGIAAISVVRAFRSRTTLVTTVVLTVAIGVLGLYAAAFSLPSAVLGSSALGNEGGFPELLAPILFGFVALFDVYLIVSALRLGRRYAPIGVATVIVGSLVGLAYLIYQRRGKADLWGYYPEKFTWLVLVMLVPITIGLLVALLSERPPQGRAQRTALGAVVVAAVLAALVASGISAPERISPVIGIVGGRVFGITNAQAEAVFTRGRRLEVAPAGAQYSEQRQWEAAYVQSLYSFVP